MVQTDKYEWLDQMLTIHCTDLTLKHKAILKSAVILFSEKGYASASTRILPIWQELRKGRYLNIILLKKTC